MDLDVPFYTSTILGPNAKALEFSAFLRHIVLLNTWRPLTGPITMYVSPCATSFRRG